MDKDLGLVELLLKLLHLVRSERPKAFFSKAHHQEGSGHNVVDLALIVTKGCDTNVILSGRNIPDVKMIPTNTINVYDILKYQKLIMTKEAVEAIEEVYA